MIYAVVEHEGYGTIAFDLPSDENMKFWKLIAIGIRKSPKDLRIDKNQPGGIHVKLAVSDEGEIHFTQLFSTEDSLINVNEAVIALAEADVSVREAVEDRIVEGRYCSFRELICDIQNLSNFEEQRIALKHF